MQEDKEQEEGDEISFPESFLLIESENVKPGKKGKTNPALVNEGCVSRLPMTTINRFLSFKTTRPYVNVISTYKITMFVSLLLIV